MQVPARAHSRSRKLHGPAETQPKLLQSFQRLGSGHKSVAPALGGRRTEAPRRPESPPGSGSTACHGSEGRARSYLPTASSSGRRTAEGVLKRPPPLQRLAAGRPRLPRPPLQRRGAAPCCRQIAGTPPGPGYGVRMPREAIFRSRSSGPPETQLMTRQRHRRLKSGPKSAALRSVGVALRQGAASSRRQAAGAPPATAQRAVRGHLAHW
jgi:hypothetical protein